MVMRMQIHGKAMNVSNPLITVVHQSLFILFYYSTVMALVTSVFDVQSSSSCSVHALTPCTSSTMTIYPTAITTAPLHLHCLDRFHAPMKSKLIRTRGNMRDGAYLRLSFCRHNSSLLSASLNNGHDDNSDEDPSERKNDINNEAFTSSSKEDQGNDSISKNKDDDEIPSLSPNEVAPKSSMSQKEFDRAVLKARAQAQIDAILDLPDAPFDLSTELQKLAPLTSVSGDTPTYTPTSSSPSSSSLEIQSQQLETSMYQAISNGDFTTAQMHKTDLDRLLMDEFSHVLQANSQFYRAFSNKDFKAMEALWLHDSVAVCIHPAREPFVGAGDILNSWSVMFGGETSGGEGGNDGSDGENTASFQRNHIEPVKIRLNVRGNMAIVTCDEEVYTRRFVRGGNKKTAENGGSTRHGKVKGMELVNLLTATNVFRKVGAKWYMVHHHSGWHADGEATKNIRIQGAGGEKERARQRYQKMTSTTDDLTVENVLGIPGHEGLYDGKKKMSKGGMLDVDGEISGQSGSGKRVFSGSLDDLLNGGWKKVLGADSDADSNEDFEEMLLEEDDDNLDAIITEETIIISNQKNSDMIGFGGINGKNKDFISKQRADKNSAKDDNSKDTLRPSCIAALRSLATRGIISKKQKRTLLTDIILSSAKGEYSLVEVAYDLLCAEGVSNIEEDNFAVEEFAEQCRVFAAAMPEHPPLPSH